MDTHAPLLFDVWREVCRHLDIAESVLRIAPLLARRFPVEQILVRRIDSSRLGVETVAAGLGRSGAAALPIRSATTATEIERLLLWCRSGQVLSETASALRKRLPQLLPAEAKGAALVAPLNPDQGLAGVLALLAKPGESFRRTHEKLLEVLREPLAVALDNDRRLREMIVLREAAEADNRSLLSRLGRHDISDSIVGAETGLRAVMEQIELVARSDVPVLILGETGSGKEVVARAIHARSNRSAGPILRVNCGAIPPDLVDSELFGHERGSFTGAVGIRKGWFERADGGTLFLDECGELPLAAQVRLLRILQDGTFERVGGERQLQTNVRIVAATNRQLQTLVAEGRFREDLWYRIAVFPIHLPPLRDRTDDIPALAAHFALRAAKRLGSTPLLPTTEDIQLLLSYSWPGNVRELAAVIERAAILGGGRNLELARALGTAAAPGPPDRAAPLAIAPKNPTTLSTLDEAMSRHIELALAQTQGRIEGPAGAAAMLAINPHTLRARMRKLGIRWQSFRPNLDIARQPPSKSHRMS